MAGGLGGSLLDDGWILRHDCVILTFALRLLRLMLSVVFIVQDDMFQDGAGTLRHHRLVVKVTHLLIVQDDPPQDGVPEIPKGLNQRQTGSSSCWCFKKSGV